MKVKPGVRLILLLVSVGLVFVVYIVGGGAYFGFSAIVQELMRPGYDNNPNRYVWLQLVPRAYGCLAVGGILGMVGSAFQAVFRNPLAEPYIVGVSSGAAVGGAIALVLGVGAAWTGFGAGLGQTILAFPCGLLTLGFVFAIARRRGVVNVQTLLLAGVVTSSMLSALLSFVLLRGGLDTGKVLAWLLGSMTTVTYIKDDIMIGALLIGAAVLICYSKQLNAFALGEETAQRLGVNVKRLKVVVLVTGAAMVSVTVGPVGIIGFLGLVAPHIARRTIAVDWRWSLPGAAMYGSILLLLADMLAHRAIKNGEIPVGIVTAIVGAPALLLLLRRD